jgi:pimeloyl-ACP methyl ester carboxylesterase
MQPATRYAKSGDVHIAYQTFGDGPVSLIIAPPFVSNVETYWDQPDCVRWLQRLASFARVVMFDKRGTGMSDRVSELPGLDQRMDDLRAVMDAVGLEQGVPFGISEGGPLAALFAATHPQRCRALVLYGGFARFASWLPTEEALASFLGYIEQAWGSGGSLPLFAPSLANDPAAQQWMGRFERMGASPAGVAALMRMNSQIDISDIVPTISVPTLVMHRTEDVTIHVEGGRYLAQHIPGARYIELPGKDHPPWIGDNAMEIADSIQEFLTGTRAPVPVDRVLSTVLFTDIVGSTEKAASLGDRRWRELLDTHHTTIRRNLTRFRGHGSNPPATAFWPRLMARLAACAAPAPLRTRSGRLASRCALGCIPANVKCWTTMSAASPFTSARASRRSRAPARYLYRAQSRIWSPAPGFASPTAVAGRSKACPASGISSPWSGKRHHKQGEVLHV